MTIVFSDKHRLKSILVVLGAVALSAFLLELSILASMHWTRFGHFLRESQAHQMHAAEIKAKYGADVFTMMAEFIREQEFVVNPLISILVGIFVGLLGKTRTGLTAIMTLLPLQLFLLLSDDFSRWAFVRAAIYFALAYCAASAAENISMKKSNNSHVPA